jgi:hypothetical protein
MRGSRPTPNRKAQAGAPGPDMNNIWPMFIDDGAQMTCVGEKLKGVFGTKWTIDDGDAGFLGLGHKMTPGRGDKRMPTFFPGSLGHIKGAALGTAGAQGRD